MGLLTGVAGVALVMRLGVPEPTPMLAWASAACIVGTMCYSLAGIYMRKYSVKLKPQGLATCSLLGAAAVLLPLVSLVPPNGPPTLAVILSILALSLLCTTVAFVIYFRSTPWSDRHRQSTGNKSRTPPRYSCPWCSSCRQTDRLLLR